MTIHYTDVATFVLDAASIEGSLHDDGFEFIIEIYLLGFVLSTWLEHFPRLPALHASAVVTPSGTAAFLASNKGGKTSLAAALLRRGARLLTDDVLVVSTTSNAAIGRAGYPQMRMWPDQASHFLRSWESLDLVHPALTKRRIPVAENGLGTFVPEPARVDVVYLPDRIDSEDPSCLGISDVPPTEGLLSLLQNSFLGKALEAHPDPAERLLKLQRFVERVRLRRLTYPSGNHLLEEVAAAVEADLAEHAAST